MSDRGGDAKLTTIEAGTRLKGTLTSDDAVLVRGVIEGEVTVPTLTVTRDGRVVGQIRVQALHSEGVIEGHVTAETIQLSGHVRDNTVMRSQALEVNPERRIDPEFVVFGDCELNIGDEPALRLATPSQTSLNAPAPSTALAASPRDGGDSKAELDPAETAAV